LSVPTYIRQQREQSRGEIHVREHVLPSRRAVGDGIASGDDSILDIPAFLRRQAD